MKTKSVVSCERNSWQEFTPKVLKIKKEGTLIILGLNSDCDKIVYLGGCRLLPQTHTGNIFGNQTQFVCTVHTGTRKKLLYNVWPYVRFTSIEVIKFWANPTCCSQYTNYTHAHMKFTVLLLLHLDNREAEVLIPRLRTVLLAVYSWSNWLTLWCEYEWS